MSMCPRETVINALYKIEKDGAYSTKAIIDAAKEFEGAQDRAFINELAMGVLRNKTRIDYIIEAYSKIKLKKISPWVLQILRTGVYQLVMMDKIPPSAACNEAVKLASKYAHKAARGYVNGLLRNIARNLDSLPMPKRENVTEFLSVMYSCPVWLTEKLISQFGENTCEEILADSLLPHSAMIRVNILKTSPTELIDILQKEGICAEQSVDVPECLIIKGAININSSDAYKKGYYTLQNINSMRAVIALDPKRCDTVIDVCAAPGGKTTHVAELMQNDGKVLGMDIHPHKIQLIESAAERLSLSCVSAVVHNSEEVKEELRGLADRVLADVPCSGIGVIHKKPDIKWNRKLSDIDTLCETQRKILNSSAEYVRNGGILVYSTCTILREENSDIIEEFLSSHKNFEKISEELYLAHKTGGSGFYICKLRKVENA